MTWHAYVVHSFGGVFLANALPHLFAGLAGRRLPTPFASPPFRGLSSPQVNLAWAIANLGAACILFRQPVPVDLRNRADVGAVFLGFGAMAFQLYRSLNRQRFHDAESSSSN